ALGDIGLKLRMVGAPGKVAVVTDRTVEPVYAPTVVRSLQAAGYEVLTVVIPAGERVKTFRWVSKILDELAKARLERGSLLLALGGGVVGDLAGFAAAIYMRGMAFVQVPTTLVAQVDSSVGGKTGVNHPMGKNLIGAFYQPRLVLIDPQTLQTLPKRQWLAGLAEVVKYGMIADEAFFHFLETHVEALLRMDEEAVAHVIARSCAIKAEVVMADERESDRRRILNYGHTVGHALESLGHYRSLMHGEAVAIGMVAEAEIAERLGLCPPDVVARQRALISRLGLPVSLPQRTFPDLWEVMQHDKKVADGRIYCVLPERIGRVRIAPLEQAALKEWFEQTRRKAHA
ncbi:MAG TPA: 3-dehydroquinate synthase, partial [Nitrospiraceae bacterium]|nr:3-dehydroquinate synthase [Nitrospiraceae bacterium]